MKRESNIEVSEDLIPQTCPSCNTKLVVDDIHLVCPNHKDCPEQNLQKLVHWCKSSNMEFFSEKSIRVLFEAKKISIVNDLYKLTEKSFIGLDGFGNTKVTNALTQIEKSKDCTIGEFCDRIGIELIGVKAIKKLGITNVKELWDFNDSKSYVIGKNLIDYLKENKETIKELLSFMRIKEAKPVEDTNGRKVCFTGFRVHSDEEKKRLEKNGDVEVDSVNKNTQLLVVKDINSTSSKAKNAKKLNIPILTYEEYF